MLSISSAEDGRDDGGDGVGDGGGEINDGDPGLDEGGDGGSEGGGKVNEDRLGRSEGGEGGGDEGRDEESKLHSDFFGCSGCLASEGRELEAGFIAPCFISSHMGDSLNSRERRRLFA